ncbi:helix-turn-helix domain-containing protein, partial [Stenotrophomonas indicatrix]|uniref:helix-turn-helix domain-containing protein n=6 Tax=Pseudomonadota TaxID=1224 RepID=UPI0013DA479B
EWLSFEDARERLAIAPNRLRSLTAAGRLPSSDSYSGMRYRRSEVDAVAATWVTITELREKLGGSTWLISAELRKAGLSVDEQGLVPRS